MQMCTIKQILRLLGTREQSSTSWWNKIGSLYIFWILKADLKKTILELSATLKDIIKICFQMKEGEKKDPSLLKWWTFLGTVVHYRGFQWQQIILYWQALKWQAALHIQNFYLMVISQGEWASLMPSHYLKPVITKLKWLNRKCMLNSRDKVKEFSWTMTLQFS